VLNQQIKAAISQQGKLCLQNTVVAPSTPCTGVNKEAICNRQTRPTTCTGEQGALHPVDYKNFGCIWV